MNARILYGILLALATAAPAFADDDDIQRIADRTGLSTRQVRMVYGPSTAYAEYRTSYDFARDRVHDAIIEDALHPAVVVGEVTPASTTTTTTTTETLPADEYNSSSEQLQIQSDSDRYDDDEYDDDSD